MKDNTFQRKFNPLPVLTNPPIGGVSTLTFNTVTNQFTFTPQKNQLAEAATAGSEAGATSGTAAATPWLEGNRPAIMAAAATAGGTAGSATALLITKGDDGEDGEDGVDGKGWTGGYYLDSELHEQMALTSFLTGKPVQELIGHVFFYSVNNPELNFLTEDLRPVPRFLVLRLSALRFALLCSKHTFPRSMISRFPDWVKRI